MDLPDLAIVYYRGRWAYLLQQRPPKLLGINVQPVEQGRAVRRHMDGGTGLAGELGFLQNLLS